MKAIYIRHKNVTDLEKCIKITGAKLEIFGHAYCYVKTWDVFLPKSQIKVIDYEAFKEIFLPIWLLRKIVSEHFSKIELHAHNSDCDISMLRYLKKNIEKVTITN